MKIFSYAVVCLWVTLAVNSICALTVDYGQVTTTAQVVHTMNINPYINAISLVIIAIFSALKVFFPSIDKNK